MGLRPEDEDRWQHVIRRITSDRDTGEVIADDDVRQMTDAELYAPLDRPRRLRVLFYLDERQEMQAIFWQRQPREDRSRAPQPMAGSRSQSLQRAACALPQVSQRDVRDPTIAVPKEEGTLEKTWS